MSQNIENIKVGQSVYVINTSQFTVTKCNVVNVLKSRFRYIMKGVEYSVVIANMNRDSSLVWLTESDAIKACDVMREHRRIENIVNFDPGNSRDCVMDMEPTKPIAPRLSTYTPTIVEVSEYVSQMNTYTDMMQQYTIKEINWVKAKQDWVDQFRQYLKYRFLAFARNNPNRGDKIDSIIIGAFGGNQFSFDAIDDLGGVDRVVEKYESLAKYTAEVLTIG